MQAPIDEQRHLVEIAELDARIAGLRHKDKHLPEQESLDELREQRRTAAGGAARARIRLEDAERAHKKMLSELSDLDKRAAQAAAIDEASLPTATARRDAAHEKGAVARLIEDLKAQLGELATAREAGEADVAHHGATLDQLDSKIATAEIARLHAIHDVGASLESAQSRRADLAAQVSAELMAEYEHIARERGAGAGELHPHRCGACQMELDRATIAEFHEVPADTVIHCPECGAILVRLKGAQ